MEETSLVKFTVSSFGKTNTDINLYKLLKNYKNAPIKIEVPIFQFANKNCLYEFGGYNVVKGRSTCMFVLNENGEICDGINFFKGSRRKINGKQAIVPITNRNYIVFGNMFHNRNNIDIRYNAYIYVISEFHNKSNEFDGKVFNYKTCTCDLVHKHSSSIFITEMEYKSILTLVLKKLLTKNCKKIICTNAWFDGNFNQNELLMIEGLEKIIQTKVKSVKQIVVAKDTAEDYFISSDILNSRISIFVFTLSKDSISINCHLFDNFDIKKIKEKKERIAPEISQSFKVVIPNGYEFNTVDKKFFMCENAEELREKITEGNTPFYRHADNDVFAIRLFKG